MDGLPRNDSFIGEYFKNIVIALHSQFYCSVQKWKIRLSGDDVFFGEVEKRNKFGREDSDQPRASNGQAVLGDLGREVNRGGVCFGTTPCCANRK